MNRALRYALAGAVLGCSLMAAISEEQLSTKMKAVGKNMGALRKGMEGGSMPDVAKAAEGIASHLKGTDAFWADRKMPDAVKFTTDNVAAAEALAAAAGKNDVAAAKAAMGKVGAACKGCHEAHREKIGENQYKIK